MAAKLTRLTYRIAIQLYIVAESCTICSSCPRQPVRKLLDTSLYKERVCHHKRWVNWVKWWCIQIQAKKCYVLHSYCITWRSFNVSVTRCSIGHNLFSHRLYCIDLMVAVVVLWEIHLLLFLKKEQMQFTASSLCQPNTGKNTSMLLGTKIHVLCSFDKPLSTPSLNIICPCE